MSQDIWIDLVVVGCLIALGYLGARLTARLRLPSVTGFLLVGILAGPYGVALLSEELMHRIAFAEPLALGIIVFLIGEQLTRRMLQKHRWSFWLMSVLNIVLPGLLVALALTMLLPDDPVSVWLLAIIAISGAPATIMAVKSELAGESRAYEMMLGASALDTVFTVLAYSVVAPFLMLSVEIHATVVQAVLDTAMQVGGGLALGLVVGLALGHLLKHVFKEGELLALALVAVLIAVAAAEALGLSSLLASLVAGVTTASVEERGNDRERVFRALRTVEYPVYIIFFTLAGAHLQPSAVLAAGGLAAAYILARSLGKLVAGLAGGLAARFDFAQSTWIGLGMLPQAGVSVGLALAAAQTFPKAGPTVNAVVLAAIVVFEVVGPMLTKRALSSTLERIPAPESALAGDRPSRTILLPVSAALPLEHLTNTLAVADTGTEPRPRLVLAHVMPVDRARRSTAALSSAEAHLQELGDALRAQGYTAVDTTVRAARSLERGIAALAKEYGADLVAMGAHLRAPRTGPGLSPLRSTQHRVLDALDVPVLIVPMHQTAGTER